MGSAPHIAGRVAWDRVRSVRRGHALCPWLHVACGAGVTVAALAMAGCTTDVYLPPARLFPVESAATLPVGDTGVQVEGGAHGAIFGVSALSGTLRVRHGVAEGADASLDVSVLRVQGGSSATSFPDVVTARGGGKYEVTRWLSLVGGVGGGESAGGGFVGPDVGAIVAWENGVFVPFLELRGAFSVPFDARPVVVVAGQPGVTPPFTWIGGGIAGFRIPMRWCDPGTCNVRTSLLGAFALTDFDYAGPNAPQVTLSLGGGAEVTF